jgi:hypothetical protein
MRINTPTLQYGSDLKDFGSDALLTVEISCTFLLILPLGDRIFPKSRNRLASSSADLLLVGASGPGGESAEVSFSDMLSQRHFLPLLLRSGEVPADGFTESKSKLEEGSQRDAMWSSGVEALLWGARLFFRPFTGMSVILALSQIMEKCFFFLPDVAINSLRKVLRASLMVALLSYSESEFGSGL